MANFDSYLDEEDAMPDDDFHEPHEKHLQLGLTPDDLPDEDPTWTHDEDAVWADATTVEQYKADIEELAASARD